MLHHRLIKQIRRYRHVRGYPGNRMGLLHSSNDSRHAHFLLHFHLHLLHLNLLPLHHVSLMHLFLHSGNLILLLVHHRGRSSHAWHHHTWNSNWNSLISCYALVFNLIGHFLLLSHHLMLVLLHHHHLLGLNLHYLLHVRATYHFLFFLHDGMLTWVKVCCIGCLPRQIGLCILLHLLEGSLMRSHALLFFESLHG